MTSTMVDVLAIGAIFVFFFYLFKYGSRVRRDIKTMPSVTTQCITRVNLQILVTVEPSELAELYQLRGMLLFINKLSERRTYNNHNGQDRHSMMMDLFTEAKCQFAHKSWCGRVFECD